MLFVSVVKLYKVANVNVPRKVSGPGKQGLPSSVGS